MPLGEEEAKKDLPSILFHAVVDSRKAAGRQAIGFSNTCVLTPSHQKGTFWEDPEKSHGENMQIPHTTLHRQADMLSGVPPIVPFLERRIPKWIRNRRE